MSLPQSNPNWRPVKNFQPSNFDKLPFWIWSINKPVNFTIVFLTPCCLKNSPQKGVTIENFKLLPKIRTTN